MVSLLFNACYSGVVRKHLFNFYSFVLFFLRQASMVYLVLSDMIINLGTCENHGTHYFLLSYCFMSFLEFPFLASLTIFVLFMVFTTT